MIRNISYFDKEIRDEINQTVGKPYSFLKRLKMGGIGSQRYVIYEASKDIESYIYKSHSSKFCNIELREKGIIIRFRSRLDTYAFIAPYRNLSIFKSDQSFALFIGAEFVRLKAAHNAPLNQKFVRKILQLKSEAILNLHEIH